jgi:hypothetical protein
MSLPDISNSQMQSKVRAYIVARAVDMKGI